MVDGVAPDLVRSETELQWLYACWQAATAARKEGVKMIDDPGTVARLPEQMQDHLPIPAFRRRTSCEYFGGEE